MKISEIILLREKFKPFPTIFSRDIKQRFRNGQVKVDGEVIKEDIDIPVMNMNDTHQVFGFGQKNGFIGVGNFIFDLIQIDDVFKHQLMIFGLEDIKQTNIKNDLTGILDNFVIIRISKKDVFVLKKKN